MTKTDETMRVWVGCLSCYNDGRLTGAWVDAVDASEFVPCDRAGHEEWWVFDTDGLPGLGECSPDEAQRYAETVAACAEGTGAPVAAVFAYLENFHGSPGDMSALDDFEDAYYGEWESERDYAANLADDLGYLKAVTLTRYHVFDMDAWTRDLFMGDCWSAPSPEGGAFVFQNV